MKKNISLLLIFIWIFAGIFGTTTYADYKSDVNQEDFFTNDSRKITPHYKLSVLLEIQEKIQLIVLNSSDDDLALTWVSSNENVATVDINGRVTAISEGTANIWAKNDNNYENSILVKVVGVR